MDPINIALAAIALFIGIFLGFLLAKSLGGKKNQNRIDELNFQADEIISSAQMSAKRIISEAESEANHKMKNAEANNESIKKRKIQESRDKFAKLKSEFDQYRAEKKSKLKERELEVRTQEKELQAELKDFDRRVQDVEAQNDEVKSIRENLEKQLKIVSKKHEELDAANEERISALENIAKLNQADAKEQLMEAVKAKSENDALTIIKDRIAEAQSTANKEAKKIVIQTIQRMAAEFTIENTTTSVSLENEDQKGQIIGREGRNIRAFEAATGVELIVDDTPEAVLISSFDSVRREVARLALNRLIADGRMQPNRIEEVVAKVKKQLDQQIIEIGERTVIDLDIHGLHPFLVRMIGRMRFRSSYGQNLLKHSIETAELCSIMAAELGLSKNKIKMAKRAGLLHDIGKVAEEQTELSHALVGYEWCMEYKENPNICNAVGAHHDEMEMDNILSPIIQACDAISGARPGARREILENYLKRINDLEEIALSNEGVQKAFAIQAGRELRVIVESEKVSDAAADDLSFIIAQKIQNEMQYPGQIKVTVIREKRAVNFAR